MNLDPMSSLPLEEVCERPEAGTCEKCGAWIEEPCQIGQRGSAEPLEVERGN